MLRVCVSTMRWASFVMVAAAMPQPAFAVRVAVVKSWNTDVPLPIFAELNNHWQDYGSIGVTINLSLQQVTSFTYADLVATNADVIWLSNPAGGQKTYSASEVDALKQYASEGHALFGTYRVFRFSNTNNSELAPLFGLPEVIYNGGAILSEQSFELLDPDHPLFEGLPSPYVSTAFARAQVPSDGFEWELNDLGFTELLAKTSDNRGVILLYSPDDYHAIYVSQLVEFVDPPHLTEDAQFIYNALTYGAPPTGECCLLGRCSVVPQEQCDGSWAPGGTCSPNPCPQLGACCFANESCGVVFETQCPTGRWVEDASCSTDSDGDGVKEACDRCPGFNDLVDADDDKVADGCDACPDFDDGLDEDGDEAPDGCDACPGKDDRLDADGDDVPDDCDECPGFDDANDCDDDGIADGCDGEPDCNNNGVPDNCDLADETSDDCDKNLVPDDCQPDSDGDRIINPCDECIGDDRLIGDDCDSPIDVDDCATGTYDCSTGTLVCTDGPGNDGIDSDGDGVFDCHDLCPGTPPDVIVLPDGCRPTGACCFEAGVCFDAVPIENCALIDGEFLGHQTTCTGDQDNDGAIGCADRCPQDPNKSAPGQCGCGRLDTDGDGDGTANCVDGCPDDPNKTAAGVCGCGVADSDSDGDESLDCQDGCPHDGDKTDPGVCGCGVADVDTDGDTRLDCEDGCPLDPTKTKPGVCGCQLPDDDSDDDGILDCEDGCPHDPLKTEPGECGCGVADADGDGDGVVNCLDGCPQDPEKSSPGVCGCNVPDDDADGDDVLDCEDECPGTPAGVPVDENGCPLIGACCFNVGVCVNNTTIQGCATVEGVYQGNGTSCADACRFPGTGDGDGDGDLDQDDWAGMAACVVGPGAAYPEYECFVYDFDHDGDVDLKDVRAFQSAFGP